MENVIEIFCNLCEDVAYEYDSNVVSGHTLDGKEVVCQSCGVIGRLNYEGSTTFHSVGDHEIPCVDFCVLVEGYEKSQQIISDLMNEIAKLRGTK